MKNRFLSALAAVVGTLGLAASAAAAPIVITFDENPPIDIGAGQIIDNEYNSPGWGNLVISADANGQATDLAVLFDTANPTGNDADLATPGSLGNAAGESLMNVLIAQTDEGGLADIGNQINNEPNDHAAGAFITFIWGVPVFDFNFHFVDMEDEEAGTSLIHFFTEPGDLVPYASLPFSTFDGVSGIDYGENSVNFFSIADVNTQLGGGGPFYSRKVVFELSASGAIGSIGYTPVPEPGTMLLFGSGLLALAGWARRRSARRQS